ncbi:hypothetical protein [Catenulispora rubra]|uniref:hypothetical protein n=1 Tax=Catenulispora rubra TaxID=280293 RepID=UPI00189287E5|nr:hypothetical protein [Catenulispora rubra]
MRTTIRHRTSHDGDHAPSAKPLILLTTIAVLLLVAVPISILVALFMIVFGHVTAGFAVIGVTVLAAIVAVVAAGASGFRHLQKIVEHKSFRVVQLGRRDYHYEGDNCGHDHSNDEIRII